MKEVQFTGESFILDPSGLLIWPAQKTAIVADLHLEKASFFALHGQMLPPQDSLETLSKLLKSLEFSGCDTLILLGDNFHDGGGFDRLPALARALWDRLVHAYGLIWATGNHDGDFVPDGVEVCDVLEMGGLTFRHEAEQNADKEISGHYHPKASIRNRGRKTSRPCFAVSDKRLILPSFGCLTGGLNVLSAPIRALIPDAFTAHLLGEGRLYTVPSNRLVL